MARRLEVVEELRFTCSECGDCCRGFDVLLISGEQERIEALDWGGRAPDLQGLRVAEPAPVPGGKPRQRLVRRDSGACVFLGERNQCRIHEHFGAGSKPLVCRLYPFSFYPLGDRTGVDVAFSCRAVSQGSGAPVALQRGESVASTISHLRVALGDKGRGDDGLAGVREPRRPGPAPGDTTRNVD